MTYTYEFPRPSVTATIVALHMGSLLVATRAKHVETYPGYLCLPGGFLNAKTDKHSGETVERTAIREFEEECGVRLRNDQLKLYRVISDPEIDPRAHVVNICYLVTLTDTQVDRLVPGDDIDAIEFMSAYKIKVWPSSSWAFNHQAIAVGAMQNFVDTLPSVG